MERVPAPPFRDRPCRPARPAAVACEAVERRLLMATFTVSNLNNAGPGSLRQAIMDSNGSFGVKDVITFTVTSGTINLASPLPFVFDPVRIDTMQPDFSTPIIELNGAGAGTNAVGLWLETSPLPGHVAASEVRGLAVNRFSGTGVQVTGRANVLDTVYVGTDPAGTSDRGNAGHGIRIVASDTTLANSVVAFNGNDGIAVPEGTGNDLSANNRIYANLGLSIDLGPEGLTPNDANDPDTGANQLQNFPVLSSAVFTAGGTSVSGALNTTPNTNVVISFYASPVSPTAAREGRTFLGTREGRTDASGNYAFNNVALPAAPAGSAITATATAFTQDIVIGTSEFSAPVFADTPPRVQQVYVRGSGWTDTFAQFLESSGQGTFALGYAVPAGGDQRLALPWDNVNSLSVRFSENVSVQQGDLTLTTTGGPISVTSFGYLPGTFTARWFLSRPLGNERVAFTLDGDAPNGVTDTDGSPTLLDGEWSDGADAYPSGNGTAGGDFRFEINSLPGDADGNGTVDVADLGVVSTNFNQSPRGPRQGDFNGDAAVNITDLGVLATHFNQTLPAADPAGPASLLAAAFGPSRQRRAERRSLLEV